MNGYEAYTLLLEARNITLSHVADTGPDNRAKVAKAYAGGAAIGGLGGAAVGGTIGAYGSLVKSAYQHNKMKKDGASEEELTEHKKNALKAMGQAAKKGAAIGGAIGAAGGSVSTGRAVHDNLKRAKKNNKETAERVVRGMYGKDTNISWEDEK